jgi:hypothetical protein
MRVARPPRKPNGSELREYGFLSARGTLDGAMSRPGLDTEECLLLQAYWRDGTEWGFRGAKRQRT